MTAIKQAYEIHENWSNKVSKRENDVNKKKNNEETNTHKIFRLKITKN